LVFFFCSSQKHFNDKTIGTLMHKSIKGTATEKNLLISFAGESQARNRYTFFESAAKKEGLEQIAFIFGETADQEKEHAQRFWDYLEGGSLEITFSFPAGTSSNTLDNLMAAAEGENLEWTNLYPNFAAIARKEGFEDIASAFEHISIAERQHEKRYRDLYDNLMNGKVFSKDGKVVWRCRNCGYLHEGRSVPEVCPSCLHPKAFFEILGENW
jgi:rubrerythrin